jgi:hypothetical protein
VALDLALSVATGRPWHGRATRRGPVVYVFAEGQAGAKKRINAWLKTHEPESPADITFLTDAVPLNDPLKVSQFLHALAAYLDGRRMAFVIVDTLAQCSGGADENSVQDMQPIIDALKSIATRTGATVLVLHHPTKANEKVARGSGSLQGAMDVVLRASASRGSVVISTEKQKDAEPAPELHLRLHPVDLGTNAQGEAVTSCVVVGADDSSVLGRRPAPPSHEDGIISALQEAPQGLRFKDLCRAVGLSESNAASALKRLQAAGRVTKGPGKRDPWVLAQALAA